MAQRYIHKAGFQKDEKNTEKISNNNFNKIVLKKVRNPIDFMETYLVRRKEEEPEIENERR